METTELETTDNARINDDLARWLNARGFDLSHEIGGEGAWFSVEARANELWFYVQFEESYCATVFKTAPLFTDALDSMALVVKAMTTAERATYRQYLIRKYGLGLGEGAVDATAPQRASAAIIATQKKNESR